MIRFTNILLFLLIISCSSDPYDTLSVNNSVPEVSTPRVLSLKIANFLVINWDKDIGASQYILYRDIIPTGSFSTVVYTGSDLEFIDSNVNTDTFYYYKLSKKRGQKEFSKSNYAFGVVVNKINDEYEDNNSQQNAKAVDGSKTANIYYYKDNYSNQLNDVDWYYVDVPSRSSMTIKFVNFSNIGNNEITYSSDVGLTETLSSNQEEVLTNSDLVTRRFYFQIYPDKSSFATSPSIGKTGSYLVKIVSWTSL